MASMRDCLPLSETALLWNECVFNNIKNTLSALILFLVFDRLD